MRWFKSNYDGTAAEFPDTAEIRARVDAEDGPGWFGTPEGAIIHGGVRACSFTEHAEQMYDALSWLHCRQLIPMGERVVRTITAQRD